MSKNKTLSLWEYINYNDTYLSLRFKHLGLLKNLPCECISSKKFLNIFMKNENLDLKFLKNVYNEYFYYVSMH